MAQIKVNGNLQITPHRPQNVVVAFRELEGIRVNFELYHRKFASAPATAEAMQWMLADCGHLKKDYIAVLQKCETALKTEMTSMSKTNRAYYDPVLTFISRASDAHTIIPFEKYVGEYRACLEYGVEHAAFGSNNLLRGFIEERIAESIETCKSYLSLLSGSLGSFIERVDLASMAQRIADIQREISIFATGHMVRGDLNAINRKIDNATDKVAKRGGDEASREKWVREHARIFNEWTLPLMARQRKLHENVHFESRTPGAIYTIGPLAYFLVEQVIRNAFKASFAAAQQQKIRGNAYFSEMYEKCLPLLPKPRVDVVIERASADKVKITIGDNGIGFPVKGFRRVLSGKGYLGGFLNLGVSNGASVRLFPFVCDLIQAEMVISSDGIGKGSKFEIILPVDLDAVKYN